MAHQSRIGRISDWLIRHNTRIRQMGKGATLYLLYNLFYDFVFYPAAIATWGYVIGGGIAALGSFLQCGVMFWLYDRQGIDWLGAHALRTLDDRENKTRLEKVATWLGREKSTVWERIAAFFTLILLTSYIDPLVVAVHFKHQHFKGLLWRDWKVLLVALISANGLWLLKAGTTVAFLKIIFLGHL